MSRRTGATGKDDERARRPARGGTTVTTLGILAAALFALAALSPAKAAPAAEERDPLSVVNAFLSALDRDEREANAMLADNAMFGVGDVGGPLTAGMLRQMMTEFRRDCRLTGLARDTRPFDMPGRSIAVIAGDYHCMTRERPEGHDLRISYLVEGERLVGVYIAGGAPRD
jgi:hypothetical protein